MYFFPGYIRIQKSGDDILVESEFYKNKIKLTDVNVKAEFLELWGKGTSDDLADGLKIFLHDQGMLITLDEAKEEISKFQKVMEKHLTLVLMPTEKCNFRCEYCYESHDSLEMKEEIVDQVLKYIKKQASNYKEIQINWFGGEPTLRKDLVMKISNDVQQLAREKKIKYAANMTTNGYLLDVN